MFLLLSSDDPFRIPLSLDWTWLPSKDVGFHQVAGADELYIAGGTVRRPEGNKLNGNDD